MTKQLGIKPQLPSVRPRARGCQWAELETACKLRMKTNLLPGKALKLGSEDLPRSPSPPISPDLGHKATQICRGRSLQAV
eukprot:3310588-Rhodomonas_salina.1